MIKFADKIRQFGEATRCANYFRRKAAIIRANQCPVYIGERRCAGTLLINRYAKVGSRYRDPAERRSEKTDYRAN